MNQETKEQGTPEEDIPDEWKPILQAWVGLMVPAVEFIKVVIKQMVKETNPNDIRNWEEEKTYTFHEWEAMKAGTGEFGRQDNDEEETKDSEV